MAAPNLGSTMDQFDTYFRRADLDHDGRISGAEAVSFFQGSGLPKQVLAQIWMHADQNRTGFLNRREFYNALKLVTVAQSKRDLTPDIVKAALYGPASSKIPPPQINLPPSPGGQSTSFAAPKAEVGAAAPTASQTLGLRGPVPPNNTISQLHFPTQGNQSMKSPHVTQVTSVSSASHLPQSAPVLPSAGISTAWFSGGVGGVIPGPTSQVPNRGVSPLASSPLPRTQDLQPTSSQSIARDPKTSVSGNGFASNSAFGGDLFSALVPKQDSSPVTSSTPVSSALVPTSLPQPTSTHNSLESLQSAFTKQPPVSQEMQTQSLVRQPQQPQTSFSLSQPVSQATSGVVSPAISSGVENSISNQSQPPWPKMTPAGIQKYSKVFMEVDIDRDGKITGEQARNLFLSWRLPREVLKQVWDLADQDNDSMLSLREFCIALYLMERYREGRPLPASLPNSIMFDETLMRLAGLPNTSYNNAALGAAPGSRHVQGTPGSQQMPAAGVLRPPMLAHQTDGMRQFNQEKSPSLQLDNSQANQLGHVDQHVLQSNSSEAIDAEKKVEKVEKVVLDSKEKLEFYRTKMQDLVLYKSRCDNRLNEIIERASADRREAEMVGKKYEEKYKQVAELASKLTIEEATFREYQERKMELRQAIINMEQGGSADGILQVRADRVQSELEELMKALAERCKRHGIEIKSAALIEVPIGWQPGIPEGAAIWDEEWDKFEDEGLIFDKDLKADAQNAKTASKPASASFLDDMYPLDDGFSPDSLSNADGNSEKQSSRGERIVDSESRYTHSEDDLARTPQGSPARPATEFSDVFTKSSEADNEFNRSFDNQGWGTFDGTDDADSVWGFNSNSKESGHDQLGGGLFESGSFGLSPVRTESPQEGSTYNNKRSLFADSVPGTPFSKSANSPRYSEAGDNFFSNYSGFDSLSVQDSRFSPPRETFSRFDSISSSRGGDTFARFDSMNSSRGEAFARFDSISSSRGFDHSRGFTSFDDADPFGSSGPFQVSSESKTPKKGSDSWSSF